MTAFLSIDIGWTGRRVWVSASADAVSSLGDNGLRVPMTCPIVCTTSLWSWTRWNLSVMTLRLGCGPPLAPVVHNRGYSVVASDCIRATMPLNTFAFHNASIIPLISNSSATLTLKDSWYPFPPGLPDSLDNGWLPNSPRHCRPHSAVWELS